MDAPNAGRGDRIRKELFEAETLSNGHDVLSHVGEQIDGIWAHKPDRPRATHTEVRPLHPTVEAPKHALHSSDVLTITFIAGILLGEGLRWAYSTGTALRERRHADNG